MSRGQGEGGWEGIWDEIRKEGPKDSLEGSIMKKQAQNIILFQATIILSASTPSPL